MSVHPRLGTLVVRVQAETPWVLLSTASGVMTLLGLGMWTILPFPLSALGTLPFGAIAWILYALAFRMPTLEVFETGVLVSTRAEEREATFEEMSGMRWRVTDVVVRGHVTGAAGALVMTLAGGEEIGFAAQIARTNADFARARDAIARQISERMLGEIRQCGAVPWLPGVSLAQSELCFDDGRRVPLTAGVRTHAENGHCTLYTESEHLALVDCWEPNFFPGLMLLERLQTRGPPSQ